MQRLSTPDDVAKGSETSFAHDVPESDIMRISRNCHCIFRGRDISARFAQATVGGLAQLDAVPSQPEASTLPPK
jgi:hypothetical protein